MAYTTIAKPSDHFDTPTWEGSNSTTTISGMGFRPDSIWIKRYDGSGNGYINNSTQGTGHNWKTRTGSFADDTTVMVASYTSDGFTLTGNINATNDASQNYIASCWKANGGTTSSNTNGSITSTVQANTTAGFSIVTWTGSGANATIGHGLSTAPKVVLVKNISISDIGAFLNMGGVIAGTDDPETDYWYFTSTTGYADNAGFWNDTAPTSTVFSVGDDSIVNGSSGACVAHCWHEVQGYSKFGWYVGNGDVNGPFIHCGFTPKFVLIRSEASSEDFVGKYKDLADPSVTTSYALGGELTRTIKFNTDVASTNAYLDVTAHGFRPTTTDGKLNGNGYVNFYMAFAEMPSVGTNGTIALAT